MTILEINERFGISIQKLRKMEKAGVLNTRPSRDPIGDEIRSGVRYKRSISVEQYLHLIRHEPLVRELELYDAIKSLRDFRGESAPWKVSIHIAEAARRQEASIRTVAAWVRQFLESQVDGFECGHQYLGVRLTYNVPESLAAFVCKKLSSCMWNCRHGPELAGFSRTLMNGSQAYLRPRRAKYDL